MLVMLELTNRLIILLTTVKLGGMSVLVMLELTNHTANYGKARRYVTVSHVRAS